MLTKRRQSEAPAAQRPVKILKPTSYAREELVPGRVVLVDRDLAEKWCAEGTAEQTASVMPLWPACPRCGAQFAIEPPSPETRGQWVACPTCKSGWYR